GSRPRWRRHDEPPLFAQHPDPKWVAPPGQSLHRLGTELDIGPPGAWGWLDAHAERFDFHHRYSWQNWLFRRAWKAVAAFRFYFPTIAATSEFPESARRLGFATTTLAGRGEVASGGRAR